MNIHNIYYRVSHLRNIWGAKTDIIPKYLYINIYAHEDNYEFAFDCNKDMCVDFVLKINKQAFIY